MHTNLTVIGVFRKLSTTVKAVESQFILGRLRSADVFSKWCILPLMNDAYHCVKLHMVRIFSVRILAVGSHRRLALCCSHFRVRQFTVHILEQSDYL